MKCCKDGRIIELTEQEASIIFADIPEEERETNLSLEEKFDGLLDRLSESSSLAQIRQLAKDIKRFGGVKS